MQKPKQKLLYNIRVRSMVGLSVVVADDDGGRVLRRHGSAARLPWLVVGPLRKTIAVHGDED